MMKVEVFGTGCVKCKRLERNVREALTAAHVQAEVIKVEDMDATVATLRERGVEVTNVKTGNDHSLQGWITDPDGNRIELHCYTPESKQNGWLA